MAITFLPGPGDVLMCEFGPDPAAIVAPGIMRGPLAVKPEIWKFRQAAVVFIFGKLAIVVPFSTSRPNAARNYHVHIVAGTYPFLTTASDSWLKADLIETVSYDRLDRCQVAGKFQRVCLTTAHLKALRVACLHALGMGQLTGHL
ncbi:MAG: hypothetical protein WCC66_13940 [Rhizobiaceae bacterium]